MLRGWRSTARSAAWWSEWTGREAPRLLARVMEAFVDRAPIAWHALLRRARSASDRAAFEHLRWLDALRHRAPGVPDAGGVGSIRFVPRAARGISILVWCLIALAAIQTACSFAVLGLAFATSEAINERALQIVLALAFAGSAVLLATVARRDPRGLFLLAVFLAAATAFVRSAVICFLEAWPAAVAGILQGLRTEAFMPAFMWQFALGFPRVRRFTAFDVLARHATVATWILGAGLFSVNLIAEYANVDVGPIELLVRNHSSNTFWYLIAAALVPPMLAMLVRSRRAPGSERLKVARFTWTLAVGTGPLLLFFVLRLVWPGVDRWLLTAGAPQRIWLDTPIVTALSCTPILASIALLVDRPLDIRTRLGRASQLTFARSAVTAATCLPFVVLLLALYTSRHAPLADLFVDARGWLLLSAAAAGCLMLAARSRLAGAFDRRLSRRAADHHPHLPRALERLRLARSTREIAALLAKELRAGIGARTVRVWIAEEERLVPEPSRQGEMAPPGGGLMAVLTETTTPLDLSGDGPLFALLPREDRDWLTAHDVELAAPVTRQDGTVAAVILCGPKRRWLPFDAHDRWLVATMAAAAGAAWEAQPAVERHARLNHARQNEGHDEPAVECPRCGVVADSCPLPCACGAEAALAALPRHLNGAFIVRRRVGAGGMGVVYLARDAALDRDVALKTLPELEPRAVARLHEEARAMAAVNHASLATIYGIEQWRRTPVLIVEYLAGGTLAQKLARGALSPDQGVRLGLTLARALAYMHGMGLLHRDLKPTNVAFTSTGRPKLLDFGLAALNRHDARHLHAAAGTAEPLAGTPRYLPPEALRGAPACEAFDLWALSVILLEAIAPPLPFAAHGEPLDPTQIAPRACGLPRALQAFFERALAPEPERRFQTSLELQAALERLAHGGAVHRRVSGLRRPGRA